MATPKKKQKPPTKKERREKVEKMPGSVRLKNVNHELFCRFYAGVDSTTFGNATQSYIKAFNKDEEIMEATIAKQKESYGTKAYKEARERLTRLSGVCRTLSARMMTKVDILERCDYLFEKVYTQEKGIDRELGFVIFQRDDLNSKVQAIREFNRQHNRVKDKIDLSGKVRFEWGGEEEEDEG